MSRDFFVRVDIDNVASRIANGEKYYSRPLSTRREVSRFVAYVDFGTDNVVHFGLKCICREQVKVQYLVSPGYPFDYDSDDFITRWVDYPNFVTLAPVDGVTLSDYPFNRLAGFPDEDDDTLVVFFSIRYMNDSERPYESKFANDHVKIFDDARFSDLTIVVGEGDRQRSFRKHRIILSARSEYFRALFESEMEETRQDLLRYEDVDADAFGHFLKFLYTANIPHDLSFEELKNLWVVANRFIAPDLEDCLEELFVQRLSSPNPIGNVLEYLSFAHEFELSLPHLLEFCLLYVRGSLRLLRTSEEWQEFERNQPELAALVLKSDFPSSSSSSTSLFLTPPTSPSPPDE